jgi:hypothetical protein
MFEQHDRSRPVPRVLREAQLEKIFELGRDLGQRRQVVFYDAKEDYRQVVYTAIHTCHAIQYIRIRWFARQQFDDSAPERPVISYIPSSPHHISEAGQAPASEMTSGATTSISTNFHRIYCRTTHSN